MNLYQNLQLRISWIAILLAHFCARCWIPDPLAARGSSINAKVNNDGFVATNGAVEAMVTDQETTRLSRRQTIQFFATLAAATTITTLSNPKSVSARDDDDSAVSASKKQMIMMDNRPFAPTVEPLVPAVLVQQQLQLALRLADEWNAATAVDDPQEQYELRSKLQSIFGKPNDSPSPRFTMASRNARYNKDKQVIETKFASFDFALSGAFVRACCNVYSANLQFGESYVLTADSQTRKALIRSDTLPDVKTVVTADLDLRDLFRNQLQTAIEDIQAELYKKSSATDPVEVQELILTALSAMNKWIGLVREKDVTEAKQVANKFLSLSGSEPNSVNQLKLPDPKFKGNNPFQSP